MDLRQYISPLVRWWWLLLAAMLIAAGSSYWVGIQQPLVYQTRATLMIGRLIEDPNPSGGEFYMLQQLAGTYADMGNREPIRNKTMEALGLTFLPQTRAARVPNSSLIEVWVTDTDPQRAQLVANELANQLILSSPGGGGTDEVRRRFVDDQLTTIQAQITATDEEIADLQRKLGELDSAREIAETQSQIAALQSKVGILQANFANLMATTNRGATNTLSLIEPAWLPVRPIGPNVLMTVALSAAIGLGLAVLAAYGMEVLDDTIKTVEEIPGLLDAPILGYIGEIARYREDGIYIAENPTSIVAEGFRGLRTNLDFAAVDRPIGTLLVTSAGSGDGKTVLACNLAVTIAQGGKRVVLLDADLRKPSVHRSFGLSNSIGVSDVVVGSASAADVVKTFEDGNLTVMTAGTLPPNPADLLGSKRFDDILEGLRKIADIVIVDSAPFIVPDSWVLAAKVDAVLWVIRPGNTRKSAVRHMGAQLQRSAARLVGLALTRLPRQPYASYYGYQAEPGPRLQLPKARRPGPAQGLATTAMREVAPETMGRRQVLPLLISTMTRMAVTSGSIIVIDESGEIREAAVAYRGQHDASAATRLREIATRGLAGWVLKNKQAVLVKNTLEDPRWLRQSWEQRQPTARSAICVPLIEQDRSFGALTLTHGEVGRFTDTDLALLMNVLRSVSRNGHGQADLLTATVDG